MNSLVQNRIRSNSDAVDSDDEGPSTSHEARIMLPSLRGSLALLYSLQGVTMQLPILALLAIVNDKVAIPPAYLSAYGAICFLPSSLKPIWATLSTIGMSIDAKPSDKINRSQRLLVFMLLVNGLSFCGTALLIPEEGIVECFVWGFFRGVTSAWANFLTDQLLILQAMSLSRCEDETLEFSYPAISSYFQSKAATYRKAGSLLAAIGTFGLFLQRQTHRDSNDKEPALSAAVVMTLLFGSAAASVLGALVMTICSSEGSEGSEGELQLIEQGQDNQALIAPEDTNEDDSGRNLHLQRNTSQYQSLSIAEDGSYPQSQESPAPSTSEEDSDDAPSTNHQHRIQNKSDIASLGLLQLLLVGGAARGPASSLDQGMAVWKPIMVLLSMLFVAAVIASTVTARQISKNTQSTPNSEPEEAAKAIAPRSLGIYLILRYSVPIASFVMYSYVYDIFGNEEPLFLQTLLILETAVAFLSSWVYTRFFSDRFHSGWAMIGLLATFTAITSLVSLLDICMVHMRNSTSAIDANLRWVVLSITLVKYFMGNINHLPAVILATANVVSPSEASKQNPLHAGQQESGHDEGLQYATFMSCINFGAQLGDWIAVPIIAGFGITRENNWANLDKFIILCAALRMISILALYIILPPKTRCSSSPSAQVDFLPPVA